MNELLRYATPKYFECIRKVRVEVDRAQNCLVLSLHVDAPLPPNWLDMLNVELSHDHMPQAIACHAIVISENELPHQLALLPNGGAEVLSLFVGTDAPFLPIKSVTLAYEDQRREFSNATSLAAFRARPVIPDDESGLF